MTREELEKEAEEYCDNLIQNETKIKSIYDIEVLQKDLEKLFQYAAKFGFNKANEWHDLRKNPNDLPNTDRNVWVKRESEIECQIDNYYEDDKGWGIMFREGYCTDDVILWCELPVPPKEIKEND